jgi:hypothetical protein
MAGRRARLAYEKVCDQEIISSGTQPMGLTNEKLLREAIDKEVSGLDFQVPHVNLHARCELTSQIVAG